MEWDVDGTRRSAQPSPGRCVAMCGDARAGCGDGDGARLLMLCQGRAAAAAAHHLLLLLLLLRTFDWERGLLVRRVDAVPDAPLMGNVVFWSGVLMLYQTHRLMRLCATTTSLCGTHCTY